jgi:hypothetical protein
MVPKQLLIRSHERFSGDDRWPEKGMPSSSLTHVSERHNWMRESCPKGNCSDTIL